MLLSTKERIDENAAIRKVLDWNKRDPRVSPVTWHYTLGGDTTGSGPYTMTSTDATYNVLRFIFDTPTTFANLSTLSVDYDAVAGGIREGAPRMQIVFDTDNDGIADSSFDFQWEPAGSFADAALGPA